MFRNDVKEINPCDNEIFQNGHTVFCISEWKSDEIEKWVREVARRSGQKVDWHYSAGRANILGLGSPEELEMIRDTIKKMLPELNQSINAYKAKRFGEDYANASYTEESINYWRDKEVFRSCFFPK